MAQFAVSSVVKKLGDLLIQEAVYLYGVREQVERLQSELIRMQCFLKDTDAKQGDARVQNWILEIRNVAYDVEDIIDTFILKEASRRWSFFKRYGSVFNRGIHLHKVGKEIEMIQTRISDISKSRETYGIKNIGAEGEGTNFARERLQRWTQPFLCAKEADIIGLEEDIKKLVAELFNTESRRCVISIVGMGGLGKTTLAKKIYDCKDVKHHFYCHAWVYVSQEYRTRDILQGIIKDIVAPATKEELEMMEKLEERELAKKVYELLEEKRYLVVIDDIWSTEAWDCLGNVFPNNMNGSRVMLTTRNKDVALYADAQCSPYELQFLNEINSWELFCKKAFPESVDSSCPSDLEKLGKEMVRRCGGLPLGLVVLGGLLSRKKRLAYEWERVLNHIGRHLMEGQNSISNILALSYSDLPYYLKSCFLYFGLFPEDSAIPVKKLIRLWVAEGFIVIPREEENMEDIAEDYLNELLDRSMVQVAEMSSSRRRVKRCRIHDLLRDLSITKARDENFIEIHRNSSSIPLIKSRRCVLHINFDRLSPDCHVSLGQSAQYFRSLLFFDLNYSLLSIDVDFHGFRLLRVLDLEGACLSHLPNTIGKLIHLRYLGLRGTKLKKLPRSIGNLRNLQTLDLWGCHYLNQPLPNVIWKLEQLRHLHIFGDGNGGRLRVSSLRNLRTLVYLEAGSWIGESLGNLTNLRKLKIKDLQTLSRSGLEALFGSILVKLDCLQTLILSWNQPFANPYPLSFCHRLSKLRLTGTVEKLLDPHEFPPNLTKLTLSFSFLDQDPMPILETLPNLIYLKLYMAYRGKEMVCSAKGFPQLETLDLQSLFGLMDWRVEEGAMPRFRHLKMFNCKALRKIPEGFKYVTTLQWLEITCMPREFIDRVRGEDSYKVQHVLSITTTESKPRN